MVAVITYPPIPIFEIGPLRLSLHGLFAAIGFLAGAWIAIRHLEKRGFDTEKYQSVLVWAFVGALLGARYLTVPAALLDGTPLLTALSPLSGSFSIMGGFVGGIVGGLIRMRHVGLSIWPTLELSAFGLALGTVVGRIGDLAIVEHLGQATSAPWGYGIRPGYDVAPQHDVLECTQAAASVDGFCGIYHHAAAYDMIGAAILLGVLLIAYRRVRLHYGQLFAIWVTWYGFQRLLLDSLRVGMGDAQIGSVTWNQVSGFVAGLGGIALFWYLELRQPPVDPDEDRARGAVQQAASDTP